VAFPPDRFMVPMYSKKRKGALHEPSFPPPRRARPRPRSDGLASRTRTTTSTSKKHGTPNLRLPIRHCIAPCSMLDVFALFGSGCALLWDTAPYREMVHGRNPREKSRRGCASACSVHFGAISGAAWALSGTGPTGSAVRSAHLLVFLLKLSVASRLLSPKVRLQKAIREQIKK